MRNLPPRGSDFPPVSPQQWLKNLLQSQQIQRPPDVELGLQKLDIACSVGLLSHMGYRAPGGTGAMLEWLCCATREEIEELWS